MNNEQWLANVCRIHIVGGPGSGKTTLARALAQQRNVRAYDLDEVGYEGGAGAKRSPAARQADVTRILAQPGWVTEGVFLWWVDDLLAAAEVVIWLDLAWPLVAWRIVTRHIKLSWQGTNRHPGLRKLLGFLRWVRSYYATPFPASPSHANDDSAVSRVAAGQYLAGYQSKLIHCQTPKEVKALYRVCWLPVGESVPPQAAE